MYMIAYEDNSSYCLAHHGIKGQKWGIRRYQNEDGSLTPEGEKRYGGGVKGDIRRMNDARKTAYKELDRYEKIYLKKGDVDLKIDKDGYVRPTNEVKERAEEKAQKLSGMDKNRFDYADATSRKKRANASRNVGIGFGAVGTALMIAGGIKMAKDGDDDGLASSLMSAGAGTTIGALASIGTSEILAAKARKDLREIESRDH